MQPQIADNWYETFFQGINCEVWENAIPQEITNQEVDFIVSELKLNSGTRILDIPCGFGRHALELAKRGFRVTGVDISETFINNLNSKIRAESLDIRAIHADILTIDLSEKYDGAICMGNSFGYFDVEHMKVFISKISSALHSGARFIINSGMIAESILSNFTHYSNNSSYTIGDITMDVSNYYDPGNSYMVSKLVYTKNGSVEEHAFKHHVFTMGEVNRLLQSVGLKVISMYGSLEKIPFKIGDRQVYLVAEKE